MIHLAAMLNRTDNPNEDFGRVIDQPWINYAGSPVDVARFEYGYDRDSVVSFRRDTVAHALGKGFDELYTRDGLNRLNDFQRGLLNSGNTAIPPADLDFQQDWDLDQVANWTGFNQDDNGDGTDSLVQTRTHNKVNEITGITNTTGSAWEQPGYDDAGNMTTLPKPDLPGEGFTAKYDAWNRLVALNDEATGTKVAEYTYDPRGFRIRKELHTVGVLTSTIDCYYTTGWQCIEEIDVSVVSGGSSSSSGTSTTTTQYIYGLRYIDDTVCRDSTPQGGSTTRLYYLSDRRFSVVAITDTSGNVLERYAYTPYGERIVMDASYSTKASSDYGQQKGFQGLRHDEESGLIENRARMLDPGTGRFLQRDPLGYPDGMNSYAAYHVLHGGWDPIGLRQQLPAGMTCFDCCGILRDYLKRMFRKCAEPHEDHIFRKMRLYGQPIPNLSDEERAAGLEKLREELSQLRQYMATILEKINNVYADCMYDCVNQGNAPNCASSVCIEVDVLQRDMEEYEQKLIRLGRNRANAINGNPNLSRDEKVDRIVDMEREINREIERRQNEKWNDLLDDFDNDLIFDEYPGLDRLYRGLKEGVWR